MTSTVTTLPHLRVERPTPAIARLVLDNPRQRNSMSSDMTASWVAAIEELSSDRELRVVVVTGEGSAFCSGGDPAWISSEPEASVDYLRTRMMGFYRAWLSIRRLEVPTIAAINGPAVGAGLCMALACDLRYAAEDALMSVPFVRLGMHPGMAATYLLPDVVGPGHARDLLLTGRAVRGEEAVRLGLVSQIFPSERFAEAIDDIVTQIAGTAPIASRYTKLALRDGGHADFEAALSYEAFAQPITLATTDLQEGVRAAKERRPAAFTGE